jgi:hypothetical protein
MKQSYVAQGRMIVGGFGKKIFNLRATIWKISLDQCSHHTESHYVVAPVGFGGHPNRQQSICCFLVTLSEVQYAFFAVCSIAQNDILIAQLLGDSSLQIFCCTTQSVGPSVVYTETWLDKISKALTVSASLRWECSPNAPFSVIAETTFWIEG